MLLSRTSSTVGDTASVVSIDQSISQRENVCLSGSRAEPTISAAQLDVALSHENIETFRPLLPVGYHATAKAYQTACAELTTTQLTDHYTEGVDWFQQNFVPYLKQSLQKLSGHTWCFDDYIAYASGSDVDMMTHIVDAVASRQIVSLYPNDWFGFKVGSSQQHNIRWQTDSANTMACLCVPSVRNGHVTTEMLDYLQASEMCLLNINLYPSLSEIERKSIAIGLQSVMDKSIISVSFSRGFGLTASQLGVILVHRDHPLRQTLDVQWQWLTYFYNAIAAKAYMALDIQSLQSIDEQRRNLVTDWLQQKQLPCVKTGSYYVKSFRVEGDVPSRIQPLIRGDVARLCFKPKI